MEFKEQKLPSNRTKVSGKSIPMKVSKRHHFIAKQLKFLAEKKKEYDQGVISKEEYNKHKDKSLKSIIRSTNRESGNGGKIES